MCSALAPQSHHGRFPLVTATTQSLQPARLTSNLHSPPMSPLLSKQTGSSPSSRQALMAHSPLLPPPMMATRLAMLPSDALPRPAQPGFMAYGGEQPTHPRRHSSHGGLGAGSQRTARSGALLFHQQLAPGAVPVLNQGALRGDTLRGNAIGVFGAGGGGEGQPSPVSCMQYNRSLPWTFASSGISPALITLRLLVSSCAAKLLHSLPLHCPWQWEKGPKVLKTWTLPLTCSVHAQCHAFCCTYCILYVCHGASCNPWAMEKLAGGKRVVRLCTAALDASCCWELLPHLLERERMDQTLGHLIPSPHYWQPDTCDLAG